LFAQIISARVVFAEKVALSRWGHGNNSESVKKWPRPSLILAFAGMRQSVPILYAGDMFLVAKLRRIVSGLSLKAAATSLTV